MGAKSECGIGRGCEGPGSSPTAPNPAWSWGNRAWLFRIVLIFRFSFSDFRFSFSAILLLAQAAVAAPAVTAPAVTLTEDPAGFTLDNGQITARIDKRSGF